MIKIKQGPTAYFDVDDTIIMWDVPSNDKDEPIVEITTKDGLSSTFTVNTFNVNHLIQLSRRGYNIVVWSQGGSDWAYRAIKALELEEYVDLVICKPHQYIDDVKDTNRFMGKYTYFNMEGKRLT